MRTINIIKELDIDNKVEYVEYLNPKYIYIPVIDDSEIKKNINARVFIGEEVANNKYSSVSGIFVGVIVLDNHLYMKIENDYMEESINVSHASDLNVINKDKFIKLLGNDDIISKLDKISNTLYINAIDDEVYCFNKYMYLKNNNKEILNVLNCLLRLYNIKSVKIVVKSNYILDNINDGSISYKIMPSIYMIGRDELLRKHIIQNGDELININDIINIIYKVKKRRLRSTTYLTINGNDIKKPCVYMLKKYVLASDIESGDCLVNNSLINDIKNTNNLVIDDNINTLIINTNKSLVEYPCIKCSLCSEVCPSKINPLVKNSKCIKCGLCNYVCPSNICVYERYQV